MTKIYEAKNNATCEITRMNEKQVRAQITATFRCDMGIVPGEGMSDDEKAKCLRENSLDDDGDTLEGCNFEIIRRENQRYAPRNREIAIQSILQSHVPRVSDSNRRADPLSRQTRRRTARVGATQLKKTPYPNDGLCAARVYPRHLICTRLWNSHTNRCPPEAERPTQRISGNEPCPKP